ncbi:hypothetical protein M408DRAFT_60671 [Serendipita vermifera MAFF 305830]|uniref:BTB domain-containing protein n=1 Tax=Serendipita vermifera MAFF 305830 TaxID=933852 RepID=A0A0C2X7G4_SERVB|nr:hypothetical protein M408DRAFT_60671 [Serendipita vermifera MAFF 305830]
MLLGGGTHSAPPFKNSIQPKIPRAKEDSNIGIYKLHIDTKQRKSSSSTQDIEGEHPLEEDWCITLPKSSKSAVSLPPSAHISTTSRSPSKYWVHDHAADSYYSADFPPTKLTNLILVAKDRTVDFHVETSIVFHHSPALATLIRPCLPVIPQSNGLGQDADVYRMDETYEVLDAILRFIYPQAIKPTVRSITHLARLLGACQKYEIATGIHTLSVLLVQFARMAASPTNSNALIGSPIQCYGIACKFGFSNIAKLISTDCLAVDPLKSDLGISLVGVASKDVRRLFELHHSRGLAALSLVDAAVDADELWCEGCSGLAAWFDIWREMAEHELKSKPVSRTVFSPSFIAGCLKQATKKCPSHCMDHYLAPKTQLRFAILQKDIDRLKDMI